jgi:hypothetical protein
MERNAEPTNAKGIPHASLNMLDSAIAEVKRELGLRRRVYARQIGLGRMSPAAASQTYERMLWVLYLLAEQKHGGDVGGTASECAGQDWTPPEPPRG